MRNFLFFIFLIASISSCTFHEPVFNGGEKVSIEKVDGQQIKFIAGGIIENKNWFGLKVKPSSLDLYVEGDYFGRVSLDNKVKIKRKSNNYVEGQFIADMEDGAMIKALRLVRKDEITIRLKGKVKAGVFIFSKKMEMDKTQTIPGSILMMKR